MPFKFATIIQKAHYIPNLTNRRIMEEFISYMNDNDLSENHRINNLKVMISFANFIGPDASFYQIKNKEQILQFLDSKKRSSEEDSKKRWITTWNGYLNRTKLFFRWLYNRTSQNNIEIPESEWLTPDFFKIESKKSRRISPGP